MVVKTDYVKFQEAKSLVFEMISRCKDEYQNHIVLNINYPMANTKIY